jgi:hypothetical protein
MNLQYTVLRMWSGQKLLAHSVKTNFMANQFFIFTVLTTRLGFEFVVKANFRINTTKF